ncbi:WapI family immunity protein [Streptacidiphilus rugosus]|uniref:WapI family immunity protein n=1 Tax=Streptacidiphilus rugosus TaxID=405783 RepID=UPI00055EC3E4|nr:hypothetical protein [Streptacidiphilus rugosus]
MKRIGGNGPGLEPGIVDYQFPGAADPRQRRSRLVAKGAAHCPEAMRSFRRPALTADDAVDLARWLGQATAWSSGAELDGSSGRLDFTEPNVAFAFTRIEPGAAELRISLDLEFSPPGDVGPARAIRSWSPAD